MPELPEVETIVRDLSKKATGLTITGLRTRDGRVIRQKSISQFSRRLKDRSIESISRRGKAIIIQLGEGHGFLVVQLMMTGQLIYSASGTFGRDTKVIFKLSNGACLHYNDYRTFGRLQVVRELKEIPYFGRLGPEPLENDFTAAWLRKELPKRRTLIKPLLLNYTFVAGIGNIYASEILFASRIDPRRPAASLGRAEITALHRNIRGILKKAIHFRGTSMNTYRDAAGEKGRFLARIHVYGRENEQCRSCRARVVREFQAGRSTFYCPHCQR